MFAAPVKARYVRFTGLSSQNGQDFGSGAEFELIKE
jgi:beta-galactosidase